VGLVTYVSWLKKGGYTTPSFFGAGTALILTHLAMLLYQGGNPLDETRRYSFTKNFLSDLGLITTYANTNQPLVVLCFGFGLFAAAYAIYCWYNKVVSKGWRVGLWLAVIGLVLVPLVPSDLFFWPHRYLVVAILTGFAILNLSLVKVRIVSSYSLVLVLFQIAYLCFIFLGPRPAEARELHVILQKVAIYSQLFLLLSPGANKKLPR
jgi:hypothetical membrane protein